MHGQECERKGSLLIGARTMSLSYPCAEDQITQACRKMGYPQYDETQQPETSNGTDQYIPFHFLPPRLPCAV